MKICHYRVPANCAGIICARCSCECVLVEDRQSFHCREWFGCVDAHWQTSGLLDYWFVVVAIIHNTGVWPGLRKYRVSLWKRGRLVVSWLQRHLLPFHFAYLRGEWLGLPLGDERRPELMVSLCIISVVSEQFMFASRWTLVWKECPMLSQQKWKP